MNVNKIYQGDCLELMKTFPDKSIDLLVTDPPYEFISKNPVGGGFMYKENKKHLKTISNSFGMSFEPSIFLKEAQRLCKKFNAYIFTNKNLLKDYITFAENNGYKWDILLWIKPNPVPINNQHYLIDKEYVLFIKEQKATFNSDCGYRKYFTVFNYPIGTKETKHPTEKPLRIIRNFIEISSNKDDLILDPFAGSGTTGVACIREKRKYILIEKEPAYIEMCKNRIEQAKKHFTLL